MEKRMPKNAHGKIQYAIAVLVMAVGLTATAHAERANRGNPRLEYFDQSVDQMIYDFMEEKHIDGLAMAIVQAPYIPRVAGYGKTDAQKGLLASSNTLWSIGPITQGYTAIAVMQLVEAGKLALGDPIGKYVANLPGSWKGLTVMELMQHATGLPDYRNAPGFDASHDYQPQQLLNSVRNEPLAFKPGTQVSQSATNFLLLGLAIEKESGMSYHDMIWNGQLKPLHLTHTMFAEDFASMTQQDPVEQNGNWHTRFAGDAAYINPTEVASGYVRKNGQSTPARRISTSSLFAYGSLWASPEDVSDWDVALAGHVLVKEQAHRDLLYKPTVLPNGTVVPAVAGWQFTGHKGFMDLKGSVPGFSAYLSRFTDKDELVCVTVLANEQNIDLTDLSRRIAAAYDVTLGSGVNPKTQETYASVFDVNETTARLERNIKAAGGKIFVSLDQQANGSQAGLSLRPTRVIIFGNPKAGTKVMQGSVAAAADLPLRIAVWKDDFNETWIGFENLDALAQRDGIKDPVLIGQMKAAVEEIVRKSANVYE
jgi:CubicO group peptidase (beta-lactamase class C family)/uncharacterized protein (DUF302 family)